jgi:signal transduction histidine kinase
MAFLPRKISWFIPTTYFLIVLIPLTLVSLLGINFIIESHEWEKQYVTERFLDSSKLIIEREVNSIIEEIDEIRDEAYLAHERHIKEYLAITINMLQVEYEDNYQIKSKELLNRHSLDAIKPIFDAGRFRSVLVIDGKETTLLSNRSGHSDDVRLDNQCVQSAKSQPSKPVMCNIPHDNNLKRIFFIQRFEPLKWLIAIELSQEQIDEAAQKHALATIGNRRYGESEDGYIFAFKKDGVFISHPLPKYVGKNMLNATDPKGTYFNQELIRKSDQGGGYVNYLWDRYNTGKLVEKVSYAKSYPDWQWIIGTGFYLDTLLATQSKQDDMLAIILKQFAGYGFSLMLILFLFTGGLAWLIYRGFHRELSHFDLFFAQDTKQATPIDVDKVYFRELKQLARSANSMLRARQKAEQQLTTVFNTIDDVIYVSDPDTYELLFVNSKFEHQFGKGFLGEPCYQVLQGLDHPCEFCSNPKIFGENLGKVHNWELQNNTDKRWYGITNHAVQWHDGRMVRFEHARDITEQKLAEVERKNYQERLEQAVEQRTHEIQVKTDQLEQANRDLEGFSYSVSHDLRSPLRAIDGFLSILKDEYMGNLDDEGLRLFGIVQNNAHKMGDLIDDILAFSRAGRLELEKQQVNMNMLVKTVWDDVSNQQTNRNIEFRCHNLPSIEADPQALRQVLYNLLTNAVKFSAQSNPTVIEVKGEEIDGYIRYSVIDNGVGFCEEYKDKLFVMFQRLHGMDEFEGTGVGLAIIKRFVQKHGGKVDAQGSPGKGATFTFDLPIIKEVVIKPSAISFSA